MQFEPLNDLEVTLVSAQNGLASLSDLVRVLVASEVAVPSGAEVMANGAGFQPLLFAKEGTQMVACFTDKSRIGEYASMTPYCLVMKGRDFMQHLPPGFGVVINPGHQVGFDISSEGIAQIIAEYSA